MKFNKNNPARTGFMGITEKHRKYFMIFSAIGILLAISVFIYLKQTHPYQSVKATVAEPQIESFDWTLNNLKGEAITLSAYKKQPVLLIFWATWCPYCKKLLPGIQQLQEQYADKGLKIIAVNIREDWKPEVYWKNHGYTFDAVLEGDDVAKKYGIGGTPGIVFIAPGGKILGVQNFSDPHHPLLKKFAEMYTH